MSYATALKRGARHNPAWQPVRVYIRATDADTGAFVLEDGCFMFDLSEETYGSREFTDEQRFTSNDPYDGDASLVVITEQAPDSDWLILWDGTYYRVTDVLGSDAFRATIKFRVKAVPSDEVVPIRNDRV